MNYDAEKEEFLSLLREVKLVDNRSINKCSRSAYGSRIIQIEYIYDLMQAVLEDIKFDSDKEQTKYSDKMDSVLDTICDMKEYYGEF